jgi:hypothetical protein
MTRETLNTPDISLEIEDEDAFAKEISDFLNPPGFKNPLETALKAIGLQKPNSSTEDFLTSLMKSEIKTTNTGKTAKPEEPLDGRRAPPNSPVTSEDVVPPINWKSKHSSIIKIRENHCSPTLVEISSESEDEAETTSKATPDKSRMELSYSILDSSEEEGPLKKRRTSSPTASREAPAARPLLSPILLRRTYGMGKPSYNLNKVEETSETEEEPTALRKRIVDLESQMDKIKGLLNHPKKMRGYPARPARSSYHKENSVKHWRRRMARKSKKLLEHSPSK